MKYILFILGFMLSAWIVKEESSQQLTVEQVRKEIKKQEIKHPNIVLRQAVWETGWFKCKYCSLKYNNLFGFRLKDCITKENPYGYIKFDTWQESVEYYKWWQDKLYSGGDYYQFLVNIGYAEGTKYVDALRSLDL